MLRLDEEMARTRPRVKIYKNENQEKIIYHQQTTKHSEINEHSDRKDVRIQNVYSSIPGENYDQKLQRAFRQAP